MSNYTMEACFCNYGGGETKHLFANQIEISGYSLPIQTSEKRILN